MAHAAISSISVLSWYFSDRMLEHRFAKIAALATFALLVIGGTVNPTGSSLACPEPTLVCHGQLFPEMTGGVFYEHGHRLAAMTVGLSQIVLTILLFRRRRNLRGLSFLLLGMVIAQGALGAITVKFKLPWFVSSGHLILGMSYFATLIYTAFRTRPQPSVVELDRHDKLRAELGDARKWIIAACTVVMIQLVLGALIRHLGAALACIGMPQCTPTGDWLGETFPQHVHMVHRTFGCIAAVVTTIAAVQVFRAARSWSSLRLLAIVAPILVLAQVGLGVATVMSMRTVPIAVGHFAGAASLWALWISALLLTAKRRVDYSLVSA